MKRQCRRRSSRWAVLLYSSILFLPTVRLTPQLAPGFNIYEPSYGFSIESESHGSALGSFYTFGIAHKFQLSIHGKLIDIVGKDEFPVYDWYSGQYYKVNTKNLLLLPVFGGVKYHPFVGQIANNFSPFVMLTAGPIVILDLPERGGFLEQWKKLQTMVNGGAFIGFGCDFLIRAGSYMAIVFGYDFLPMGQTVDGRKNYSGTVVKFMIGLKRKS